MFYQSNLPLKHGHRQHHYLVAQTYYHLFKRPDGNQILFANDQTTTLTIDISLKTPGHVAYIYGLNGHSLRYKSFDGRTLRGVHLSPGNVAIFENDP